MVTQVTNFTDDTAISSLTVKSRTKTISSYTTNTHFLGSLPNGGMVQLKLIQLLFKIKNISSQSQSSQFPDH